MHERSRPRCEELQGELEKARKYRNRDNSTGCMPHILRLRFSKKRWRKKQKEIRLPENYLRGRNISPLHWSLINKIFKIIFQI